MSSFKVEIVQLEEVVLHPNADKLDLCKIRGWQCVAQREKYKTGDLALYIPIDSVLPETLVLKLGIEKMYRKRIRSIKLRGMLSQGMLAPLDILPPGTYPGPRGFERRPTPGDDVTSLLGITKYEEPIPVHMSGVMLPQEPYFFKYTDIENYKNYPNVFALGEQVVVTEKLHGSSGRAAKIDGKLYVGSHNCNLKESETNLYWRSAKLLHLEDRLQEGEQVFWEVYGKGVQDLTYGESGINVAVFDFMKKGQYVDYLDFAQITTDRGWLTVPKLFAGEWNPETPSYAQGNSAHCPSQIKEGVVVKPLKERHSDLLQGRCITKIIGDQYYLRKEGTERH